jgi:hypothetical protein
MKNRSFVGALLDELEEAGRREREKRATVYGALFIKFPIHNLISLLKPLSTQSCFKAICSERGKKSRNKRERERGRMEIFTVRGVFINNEMNLWRLQSHFGVSLFSQLKPLLCCFDFCAAPASVCF